MSCPIRGTTHKTSTAKLALTLVAVILTSSCATRWNEPPSSNTPPPPETRTSTGELQKSRYGNPPLYEVFGKRYYTMDSSLGYHEKGTASWYGKKFHGRKTSSGEVYDMYAMTAAHKSLPLPTNVRVTNLNNGKSVIVRVNDRGPFVGTRLIDMSYAAAKQLDMVTAGTAPVEIIALNPQAASKPAPATVSAAIKPQQTVEPTATATTPVATPRSNKLTAQKMFIQAGAFGVKETAQRIVNQISDAGIKNAFISSSTDNAAVLYRVRIGPLDGVAAYDETVATLATIEMNELQLVFETPPAAEETAALNNQQPLNGG